jgi:uncharacterized delta-60 repeat protein
VGQIDLVGHGSSSLNVYVAQLTATGQLDPNFGTGGVVGGTATVPWSTTGWNTDSTAVKVDPLGRFVIGGYQGSNNIEFVVMRLTPAGALDTTFGVGGIGTSGGLVTLNGGPVAYQIAMTLQPDGKTVLVGSTSNDYKFAAVRFTGDSALVAASLPQHATLASVTSAEAQPAATTWPPRGR